MTSLTRAASNEHRALLLAHLLLRGELLIPSTKNPDGLRVQFPLDYKLRLRDGIRLALLALRMHLYPASDNQLGN